jgi:hypothetical protein
MRKIFLSLFFALSIPPCAVAADDVLVSHYEVLKQCKKISFLEKTTKEANTPEGQAIIGIAANIIGVNPNIIKIGLSAIPVEGAGNEQDTYPFIRSPVGYTICSAKPSNLNTGSGQFGIETHGDTTFNSVIVREQNKNGLGMYMVVPCKAGTDTRVQAGFDAVFVRADPGWESKYKCMKTGSNPWLARNNETKLGAQ